jgi:hypothetical protein
MIRRLALTLVPSVALYTLAACLGTSVTSHAAPKASRQAAPAAPTVQLAARSGYIVASS